MLISLFCRKNIRVFKYQLFWKWNTLELQSWSVIFTCFLIVEYIPKIDRQDFQFLNVHIEASVHFSFVSYSKISVNGRRYPDALHFDCPSRPQNSYFSTVCISHMWWHLIRSCLINIFLLSWIFTSKYHQFMDQENILFLQRAFLVRPCLNSKYVFLFITMDPLWALVLQLFYVFFAIELYLERATRNPGCVSLNA